MLNVDFSPWPSYSEEEAMAIKSTLLSNKVNYWTGTECREFEIEFAKWVGVKYAVALSNGTLALELALKALNIGCGDEVIVTSRTFIASVSSIVLVGATPVFADVDENSQNIYEDSIQKVISSRTKAIICVHLAGWPCDMDPIMELARKQNLYVIEDCAQAHGARYKNKSVGAIGHIAAWSFCQDKIMTTGGEGGMVTTNDPELWARTWSYKDHGKSWGAVYEREHSGQFRWLHDSFGTNARMMELQAVVGRIQLRKMSLWHNKRLSNAQTIWNAAKKIEGIYVPAIPTDIEHAAYKCYIFIKIEALKLGWDRDRIIVEIRSRGVPCYAGSCPEVYLEKACENTSWIPKKRLPIAKKLGETSLMFLVHPTLTEHEISKTCVVLKEVMSSAVTRIENKMEFS